MADNIVPLRPAQPEPEKPKRSGKPVLSDAALRAAKPAAKDWYLPDHTVKGLRARVRPSGAISFELQYRPPGARSPKKVRLGAYGELTLSEARKRARAQRALIDGGEDPAAAKRTERRRRAAEQSFQEAAEAFLSQHADHHLRPATAREYRRILETEFGPRWRGRPLSEIDADDVAEAVGSIERRAPASARLAFATLRAMFAWHVRKQRTLARNPCDSLEPPRPPKARDRVLSDQELALIWRAIDAAGAHYAPLLKLLMLTGQRRNTVAAAEWSEFDLEAGTWLVPRSKMKNDREHLVPLGPTALAMLRQQPRTASLVFPGREGRPLNGWGRPKAAIDAAVAKIADAENLPLPARWTFHDWRRTCASTLAGYGYRPEVIERHLAHISGAQGGLTGVYQRHRYASERRQAAHAWDRHIRQVSGLD